MVKRTGNTLPFDVICLLFQWLGLRDLSSVALACHSWHEAAVSRIYETIVYTLKRSKRNEYVMNPFQVILAHPDWAVHMKTIVVRSPTALAEPDAQFLATFIRAMALAQNIKSITCDSPELIPQLISRLHNKKRLTSLKLTPTTLSISEALLLSKVGTLQQLSLNNPSRAVLHTLPQWIKELKGTLRSLTINNSFDLNKDTLNMVLSQVPELHTLHIQDCIYMTHNDVFKSLHYLTSVQNLAITVYTASTFADNSWPQLISIRHLKINVRKLRSTDISTTLENVLKVASQAPLESLTIHAGRWVNLGQQLLSTIVNHHKSTLKRLNLVDFKLSVPHIEAICQSCTQLQQIAFQIDQPPHGLGIALGQAPNLKVLIDTYGAGGHGAENASFYKSLDVRHVFSHASSLKRIMLIGRTWAVKPDPNGKVGQRPGFDHIEITPIHRREPYIYHFD